MEANKFETTISDNRSVLLIGLPFPPGAPVEVIVLGQPGIDAKPEDRYPLRGKAPYRYEDPFEPVAEADWEALR